MIISYGFVISSERSDERSLLLSVVDDWIRCFASLQHDSAMIIPYGFVISSERSDERSLLLSVVKDDKEVCVIV
ncbi:MAG: hypothetical protein E7086_10175 [Bacteroidales bacterium]|nr:hypothetical protein [Bacteroidales bacterium]